MTCAKSDNNVAVPPPTSSPTPEGTTTATANGTAATPEPPKASTNFARRASTTLARASIRASKSGSLILRRASEPASLLLQTTSKFAIGNLERFFHWWGLHTATNPVKVIVFSLLFTAICCAGLMQFRVETQSEKLWLPPDSPVLQHKAWREEFFQETTRIQRVMITHEDNVLTPRAMQEMLRVRNLVYSTEIDGTYFRDLCVKVPIVDDSLQGEPFIRSRRSPPPDVIATDNGESQAADPDVYDYYGFNYYGEEEEAEGGSPDDDTGTEEEEKLIDGLPPEIYCDLVTTLPDKCAERSILEVWNFDEDRVANITQEDILAAVNAGKIRSPVFGYPFDFSEMLGMPSFDEETGQMVVGAKSMLAVFLSNSNEKDAKESNKLIGVDFKLADPVTMAWEQRLIEVLLAEQKRFDAEGGGYRMLIAVERSFGDVSTQAVLVDLTLMFSGFFVMFVYTMLMLGKPNWVEQRMFLAATGLFSVALGLLIAIGITMIIGLPYTTIHGILPFLALGIGIDDMFVIVQCMNNLPKLETTGRSVEERIAITMRHAGVAISVTSLTDVLAFSVGAITVLPGLQSFCVSAAIAIAAIFVLQSTWFIAWLAIDQKRIEAKRDGFLPCCIQHAKWSPPTWSSRQFGKEVMSRAVVLMRSRLVQAIVMLITLGLFSVGIYGTYHIKVAFDPILMLPEKSYLRQYSRTFDAHFSTKGWDATIYTGESEYTEDVYEKIDNMSTLFEESLEKEGYITGLELWWPTYKSYLASTRNISDWHQLFSTDDKGRNFAEHLSDFLFYKDGGEHRSKFNFDGDLVCNEPAPQILSMKLGEIVYAQFKSSIEHAAGRASVQEIFKAADMPPHTFTDSTIYTAWETDDVIGIEMRRNLCLAMLTVLIITSLMLADVRLCVFVLTCVSLTLVDVIGFIYLWGLTIDTLTCMSVVLVVGLCVDYSAHIAHAFIVSYGTSAERAGNGLTQMGPAVLNGGITTFLALIFLSFSNSYAYTVFFRVFILSVLFGLFHGLVFLPVILSILGADKHMFSDVDSDEDEGSAKNVTGFRLFLRNLKPGCSRSWDLRSGAK